MVRASSISSCSVVWHFFLKFLFCQYRFLLVPSLRRSKLEASAFRSSASAISSCSASARASTIRASTARASTRPGGGVLLSCSLCLCSSFVQLQTLASRPENRPYQVVESCSVARSASVRASSSSRLQRLDRV
ncbi:uncharacterized protein LOC116214751 isoform X2 [Punica granatum]|uniref:Uncharacterized protein LOC116214751 isoform X2 n=1 Tax=Punica granatum TaxID=22663 RepID=A0A6P8EHY6_PUNGR|nr:uncharacterized protein LOC116214751 isoform X2 [Punica granatum]